MAMVPPAPEAARTDEAHDDPERARTEALRELAKLIAALEQWRRDQLAPPTSTEVVRWLVVRDGAGGSVRIRFEQGRPVQLRASAADRVRALEIAMAALDAPIVTQGTWKRDARTLDWVVAIRVPR
jgi:hypothetical protein